MHYQDVIEITPGKRSGKPCIKNTRITVYDVLGWLANGMRTKPSGALKFIKFF